MKKTLLCALVICCLATYQSYAQIEWDAEKFMPLSEVKAGMKGKGYTVFSEQRWRNLNVKLSVLNTTLSQDGTLYGWRG